MFDDYRELLFSIVYNMLGTVADTEDVLQETWLAWAARGPEGVENPRAYLVRVAVNRALAHRAAVSRRRETYVGPWLPEPLVAGPDQTAEATEQAESVSMALLVVLETLTPLERAVFVLHEVFGYAHTEIAEMLERTPAAVRQVAHRAREAVHARRPRSEPDPRLRREVTERFMAATLGGDLEALLELLAPDVTLWGDGGANAPGGLQPLQGRDKVARLLVALAGRTAGQSAGLDVAYRRVNGDPSALLLAGDAPFAVIVLDLAPGGGEVCGVYAVSNPEKLGRVA